jgi:shikimate 5-dehydrogenase
VLGQFDVEAALRRHLAMQTRRYKEEATAVASKEEILEENRKVRRLQIAVDLVLNLVAQSDIPVEEASELVAQTRRFALDLFPDKAQVYDIIYQPKFKRLMAEKYRMV